MKCGLVVRIYQQEFTYDIRFVSERKKRSKYLIKRRRSFDSRIEQKTHVLATVVKV